MSKPSGGVSRHDFNESPVSVIQAEEGTVRLVHEADQQRPFLAATPRAQS